jgi:hypothetical protein
MKTVIGHFETVLSSIVSFVLRIAIHKVLKINDLRLFKQAFI